MSALTTQFDADILAIESEVPLSFVWMGKTLPGSRTPVDDRQELADAGIVQLYDLEIVVRVSVFAGIPMPSKNDDIQVQDGPSNAWVTYRIDKISRSQDGVCLTLGCVQRN